MARLLLIKLLQAVSSDIKPKLIGCRHASEVWQRLKPSLTALDAHTVTTELNHVSLLNHDTGEVSIEFTGEKGSRTATISKEMIDEIKTVFDLYSELKTTE